MNKEKNINFFYYLFGFKRADTPFKLLLVISTHIVAWLIFFTLPLFFFRIEITTNNFLYKELINKLFLIAFFYFHYFLLIPRLFLKRKRVQYLIVLLVSVFLLFIQHLTVEKLFLKPFMKGPEAYFSTVNHRRNFFTSSDSLIVSGRDSKGLNQHFPPFERRPRRMIASIPERIFFMVLTNVTSSCFFLLLLGGFIHLTFYFIKSQDEKRALENASLQAENNLLKSQINPHFLFNTLNSIYALAYQKSDNAEKSILKLSEILRYMIYETSSEKIELEKDIYYLSSYIDLQRLRLPDKVKINYQVEGSLQGCFVAPLLLITFIENAFKHGISYTHPSTINIIIKVFDKTLTLLVSNPIVSSNKFDQGGMGLKNAQRRLELLYPGHYDLDIVNDKSLYVVNLKINLNRD